jgi:hypothetical protein
MVVVWHRTNDVPGKSRRVLQTARGHLGVVCGFALGGREMVPQISDQGTRILSFPGQRVGLKVEIDPPCFQCIGPKIAVDAGQDAFGWRLHQEN